MVYLQLFAIFFKVGILGFGGGYAILTLIFQDVQAFGMMSAGEFANLVALSQVTPGPIAINAATYVGFNVAGLPGAVLATVAVSLPSFLLCLAVLMFIEHFKTNAVVASVLAGIRPATVGLMAGAFLFMAQTAVLPGYDKALPLAVNAAGVDWVAVTIFVVVFALILTRRFGAITLTLGGGALGLVLCSLFSTE